MLLNGISSHFKPNSSFGDDRHYTTKKTIFRVSKIDGNMNTVSTRMVLFRCLHCDRSH